MDLGHGNNNHLSFGGDQVNNLGSRVDRKDEKQKRFTVFKDIFLYIHEHNQGSRSYKLALNQFADLSREEFKATYLGAKLDTKKRLLRSPSAHTSILIARICQSPLTGDKREPWRSREGPGFMWKLYVEVVQRDGPEFLPHLTKFAGIGIGELRESGLTLNARNDKVLRVGMVFNVALGLQNLSDCRDREI